MRELTIEEEKVIKSLKRLAKKWPKSLKLFSWSGTLCVMDNTIELDNVRANDLIFDTILGIPNDGGDPF